MSCKANLLAAIRDYANEAKHIGSSRHLLEQLQGIAADVERLPDPQSQGEGSMPPQHPGTSSQREEMTPGMMAAHGATSSTAGPGTTIHISIGGGKEPPAAGAAAAHGDPKPKPNFPNRAQLLHRMKGKAK